MAKTASKKAPKSARAKAGKPDAGVRKTETAAKTKPEGARGKLERVRVPSATRRDEDSRGK
jgi:hypothetical protein